MKDRNQKNLLIPESHKTIVRERIKKSAKNPENLLDWVGVKDDFQF